MTHEHTLFSCLSAFHCLSWLDQFNYNLTIKYIRLFAYLHYSFIT